MHGADRAGGPKAAQLAALALHEQTSPKLDAF